MISLELIVFSIKNNIFCLFLKHKILQGISLQQKYPFSHLILMVRQIANMKVRKSKSYSQHDTQLGREACVRLDRIQLSHQVHHRLSKSCQQLPPHIIPSINVALCLSVLTQAGFSSFSIGYYIIALKIRGFFSDFQPKFIYTYFILCPPCCLSHTHPAGSLS